MTYLAQDDSCLDGPLVALWTGDHGEPLVDAGLIERLADRMKPFISVRSDNLQDNLRRDVGMRFAPEAVRKAVLNALVHRDWTRPVEVEIVNYADRLEITSPGALQNSMTIEKMQYTKRGAFILWVVPLTEDLGTTTFRPRLFERFLHIIYYGRVYYWLRGYGTQLQPVHFRKAERYIEVSNWFEPDGSERVEGGYNKPYKRVKTPLYGDLVDLTEQFETHSRDPFELENDLLSVPSAKIFRDTLEPWW